MPIYTIEKGPNGQTTTVNTDACALFKGEYGPGWLAELKKRGAVLKVEYPPFPSSAKTDKGKMIDAVSSLAPPDLRYPAFLFSRENTEELKRKIQEAIKEGNWVGIVTCYSDGQKYAGKSHYVMGLDDEETFNFFFGEFRSNEERRQAYEKLRSKYPHFHLDIPLTYQDWLKEEQLKEVAVFVKPPGHAYRQENHFVCGAYLKNGELVIEIYPFTYHTRSQDKRNQDTIFTLKISQTGTVKREEITEERVERFRAALKKFYETAMESLNSLGLNAPDAAKIDELVTVERIDALIRNITYFFLINQKDLIFALRKLGEYGYLCLDLIGKIGENNSVEYCQVFEAKGINF